MTLDTLILENYGAYRGKHTIKLTPPSRKRPIVLFGGMNGAGKTTVLDALQLVLYGKRARCSNRGTTSYDEFLRHSVNRYADPAGGAKIKFSFHHSNDGSVPRSCNHSLRGLDLVDRLHDDLDVVANRKEKLLHVDDSTTNALSSADREVRDLRSRRDEVIQSIAGSQSQLGQVDYRLEQVAERLHAEGGELFAQKDLLESNRAQLVSDLGVVDESLRELASGSAPLLLIPGLIA